MQVQVVSFERTYSATLADEAGVPIDLMKKVLDTEGREDESKSKVLSSAQNIWNSRAGHTIFAGVNAGPEVLDTANTTHDQVFAKTFRDVCLCGM